MAKKKDYSEVYLRKVNFRDQTATAREAVNIAEAPAM